MSDLPTAAIFVAIPREYDAVRERLNDVELKPKAGETFRIGRLDLDNCSWQIILKETGRGNVSSSQAFTDTFHHFELDLALFVGTAGGLKDVKPGDVIAATQMTHYHRGVENDEFEPRFRSPLANRTAEECARAITQEENWIRYCRFSDCKASHESYTGAVASGEAVVKSENSEIYRRIDDFQGDCIGVEMEGYGFYQATRRKETPKLAIRGVFDYVQSGDEYNDERSLTKEEIEEEGYKRFASEHATAFMTAFLDLYPEYRGQLDAITIETDESVESSSESGKVSETENTDDYQFTSDTELADGLVRGLVDPPSGISSVQDSQIGDADVVELETAEGYPAIGVIRADIATEATVRDVENLRLQFNTDGPLQPNGVILSPKITDAAREKLQNTKSQFIPLS